MAMTAMSLRCLMIIFMNFNIEGNFEYQDGMAMLEQKIKKIDIGCMDYYHQIIWKIQSIMREITAKIGKSLHSIPWGDQNTKITNPTKPTNDLLTCIKQMIRAIEEYLHKENMSQLFTSILMDIEEFFLLDFKTLEASNALAGNRIREEIEYFVETLKIYFNPLNINCEAFESKAEEIIITKFTNEIKNKENFK